MNSDTIITVISPTFNSVDSIKSCIESVIFQFQLDFKIEHIIIDGGSKDGTVEIIEAYKQYFTNQHFPISEKIHSQTLSLPLSTFHSHRDIQFVSEKITDFFKGN